MGLATDFPPVVIDQSAETKDELRKQWPKGPDAFDKFVAGQVKIGAWERVFKKVNGKLRAAYRRRKAR